jgi:hypothetical protein
MSFKNFSQRSLPSRTDVLAARTVCTLWLCFAYLCKDLLHKNHVNLIPPGALGDGNGFLRVFN